MIHRTLLVAVVLAAWVWPAVEASQAGTTPGVELRVATDADSARAEIRLGRYWHASRILREMAADSGGLSPDLTMLLAEADVGWRHWDGVIEGLEGVEWIDAEASVAGLLLLARAYEGKEDWSAARQTYARLRAISPKELGGSTGARSARALSLTGSWDEVSAQLEVLAAQSPRLEGWSRLEASEIAADSGLVLVVRDLVRGFSDARLAERAWELGARALLRRGDSVRALVEYEVALPTLTGAARRARAWTSIGRLRLAAADSAGALEAYRASLSESSRGSSSARSALGVLALAPPNADELLVVAGALDRAGEVRAALTAHDRYLTLLPGDSTPAPEVALVRGRLLAAEGRPEEAVQEFRTLQNLGDSAFQLRVLDQWRRARRGQNRHDAGRTIDEWILERHPRSGQSVEILFFRGDALQDGGQMREAVALFERSAEALSTHATAGQARMRMGQIRLELGEVEAAAEAFNAYLTEFPNGRRWAEASYWLAHTYLLGDERERAVPLLERIQEEDPLGYYAVLSAEALGDPFTPRLDEVPRPADPPWLPAALDTLDLILAADLSLGADDYVDFLEARAASAPQDQLALGEALLARGLSVAGINMGWAALAAGYGWDRRLAMIVFPFPYSEIIRREAAERELDPMLLAALIRQESAFAAPIRSRAGAIGLMQVMPETGKQIARAERVLGFSPESLETPEINLHLGTTFLSDMNRRFGDRHLPLLLSAYNAGPTRANRWRRFPEVTDELRFVERIPFTETRGYVKNIRRNLALYRLLYGD